MVKKSQNLVNVVCERPLRLLPLLKVRFSIEFLRHSSMLYYVEQSILQYPELIYQDDAGLQRLGTLESPMNKEV